MINQSYIFDSKLDKIIKNKTIQILWQNYLLSTPPELQQSITKNKNQNVLLTLIWIRSVGSEPACVRVVLVTQTVRLSHVVLVCGGRDTH